MRSPQQEAPQPLTHLVQQIAEYGTIREHFHQLCATFSEYCAHVDIPGLAGERDANRDEYRIRVLDRVVKLVLSPRALDSALCGHVQTIECVPGAERLVGSFILGTTGDLTDEHGAVQFTVGTHSRAAQLTFFGNFIYSFLGRSKPIAKGE
ncbi:hypothetical protein [Pseudomonas indica]|uniref:Uncharacterized protein n=1 Tax=Pseudomonas indica TaxID=137658 RepID=A0A1G9HPG9_9PSED|nr:hypothetical protein [Pseudomonas indica]SDL14820.1 hypothetical protein SAMN05216186_115101 [Pseudomonas indica]